MTSPSVRRVDSPPPANVEPVDVGTELAPLIIRPENDRARSSLAPARQPAKQKTKSFFEPLYEFGRNVRGFFACLFVHPRTNLYEACMQGLTWTARGLLVLGKKLRDDVRKDLLRKLYNNRRYDIIALLVKMGMGIDYNDDGQTLLHLAIVGDPQHDIPPNPDFALQLIEAGADVEGDYLESACTVEPPSFAVIDALLKRGVKATPMALIFAISHKASVLALHLMEQGDIDLDAKVAGSGSFMHLASQYGLMDVVDALLAKKVNVNAQDRQNRTPLHLAENEAIAFKLIQSGAKNSADKNGITPLIIALQKGYGMDVIRPLVESGENLEATVDDESTLQLAYKKEKGDVVDMLLAKGVPNDLFTLALQKGDLARVKQSITDQTDVKGAFFSAARIWSQWKVAAYLFTVAKARGIDIDLRTEFPLDDPKSNTAYLELVLALTDPEGENLHPQAFLIGATERGIAPLVTELVNRGAGLKKYLPKDRVEKYAKEGWTLMHMAVALGHLEVVKALREAGHPIARDKIDRVTPLLLAAQMEKTDIAGYLISKYPVGALNAVDNYGQTALHAAAYSGDVATFMSLVSAGAKIVVQDKDGLTPLHWACHGSKEGYRKGHRKIVEFVLKEMPAAFEVEDAKGFLPQDRIPKDDPLWTRWMLDHKILNAISQKAKSAAQKIQKGLKKAGEVVKTTFSSSPKKV